MKNELKILLANTYALYLKTQNYHWNVKSNSFFSYHLFLEKQYEELASAADEIAEHIRTYNVLAPGSFKEFSELMTIKEAQSSLSDKEMLKSLIESHKTMCHELNELITKSEDDQATQDLAVERLRAHKKAVWMLEAHFPH